jgi:hypothetical protein
MTQPLSVRSAPTTHQNPPAFQNFLSVQARVDSCTRGFRNERPSSRSITITAEAAEGRHITFTLWRSTIARYAIANGFRTLNLSTGRDLSKTRWAPGEVVYRSVEFSSPTRIDMLKHRGYRAFFNYVQQRSPHGWVSRTFSRGP